MGFCTIQNCAGVIRTEILITELVASKPEEVSKRKNPHLSLSFILKRVRSLEKKIVNLRQLLYSEPFDTAKHEQMPLDSHL
jgi:hypothetical protein